MEIRSRIKTIQKTVVLRSARIFRIVQEIFADLLSLTLQRKTNNWNKGEKLTEEYCGVTFTLTPIFHIIKRKKNNNIYIYIYIYIYVCVGGVNNGQKFPMFIIKMQTWVECSPMARETRVQSQVESYQRLKKWYLILPCLTLSNITDLSRVKLRNPGEVVASSLTPRCRSYWKRTLTVVLYNGRQLYFILGMQ